MTKSKPYPVEKQAVSSEISDADSGEQTHQSKPGRKLKRTDPPEHSVTQPVGAGKTEDHTRKIPTASSLTGYLIP